MSETTKTYVFPENGGTSSNSMDPNMLLAMMGNNGGGFGNNSWIWVIFLFFLYGWRGNGLFGNSGTDGTNNTLNNDFGRSMLLEAINGNRNAISNLSTQLGCSESQIQSAINNVQSSIQSVGNQVGLSGQQVINSIQNGNMSLATQLSQCCCDNKLAICNQTNTLSTSINDAERSLNDAVQNTRQAVVNGFASTAYETQAQTCNLQNTVNNGVQNLKDVANANNNAILAKLSEMQTNALQDKLTAMQTQNAALKTQIDNGNQTAAIAQMLAPMQAELNAIKAAQPATTTVQYPQLTAVPSYYLYGNGYGGYGYGGNGFWS